MKLSKGSIQMKYDERKILYSFFIDGTDTVIDQARRQQHSEHKDFGIIVFMLISSISSFSIQNNDIEFFSLIVIIFHFNNMWPDPYTLNKIAKLMNPTKN